MSLNEGESDSSLKDSYLASSGKPNDTSGKTRFSKADVFAGAEEATAEQEPEENEVMTYTEEVDESNLPAYALLMLDTCRAKWKNVGRSLKRAIHPLNWLQSLER